MEILCREAAAPSWMTSHDFIAMVGTDQFSPDLSPISLARAGKVRSWRQWSVHTYSWRGSSQSHSGLSTEDAKKGRKGKEAPELLLASNLGLPAPPGCTGALDWHATTEQPFNHSIHR